jgi:hypothetical protein
MPVAKFLLAIVGALIVAAMLIKPAHQSPRLGSAYASMKADLRNLVVAQDGFHLDSARYAGSRQELSDARYQTSSGVSVELTSAGDSAWTAIATNSIDPEYSCRIAVSIARSGEPVVNDSEPVCHPEFRIRRWRWAWQ